MATGRKSTARAGYDANFERIFNRNNPQPLRESEVESFRCFTCRLLLRQPSQLSCCGSRCCRGCVDNIRSRHGKVFRCPKCNEEVGDGSNQKNYVFPDASCTNDMKYLETECSTKPKPCNWRGKLLQLEIHLAECGNVVIPCTLNCGATMMRRQLSQHLKIDCLLRIIECHYCLMKIQVAMIQEHLVDCSKTKDNNCPFCGEKCQSKEQLKQHVHSGQCKEALLSCPMKDAIGCMEKVKPTELVAHSVTHIKDVVHDNHRSKEIHQRQVAELNSEIEALQVQLKRQLEHMSQLEQDMAALKQGLTSQVSKQQAQVENLTANFELVQSKAANTKPSAISSSDLSHVEGVVRTLQHNVDSLSRQVQTMSSKVEENSEQAGALQTGIDQCTTAINQVNGLLNEVGLKVDILAVRSINGILIWKVNEVEKRIEEARTGKILSLYSPPFFTSLHGYRMCLRLYLDGDGQGKGTHVSLFLVIMKSDYDDLLSWPFKQKVTLYLLNQQDPYNTRAHIAQAFRPTETSTSFQKPKGPFNTASGFPRFAPIAKLYDRSYVQDDCMYFKVKIDMTDLKAPDFPAY